MKSRSRQHQPGTPATQALTRAGVDFTAREYDHDPGAQSYGLEAAELLQIEPARVFKTLVAQTDRSADKGLVVAVLPVDHQLDLKALAREVRCKRAVLADPVVAERTTGYVVGGISPVGQKRPLVTIVDASALRHRSILVSGGRRGLDLELAPEGLLRATDGRTATIAR